MVFHIIVNIGLCVERIKTATTTTCTEHTSSARKLITHATTVAPLQGRCEEQPHLTCCRICSGAYDTPSDILHGMRHLLITSASQPQSTALRGGGHYTTGQPESPLCTHFSGMLQWLEANHTILVLLSISLSVVSTSASGI